MEKRYYTVRVSWIWPENGSNVSSINYGAYPTRHAARVAGKRGIKRLGWIGSDDKGFRVWTPINPKATITQVTEREVR